MTFFSATTTKYEMSWSDDDDDKHNSFIQFNSVFKENFIFFSDFNSNWQQNKKLIPCSTKMCVGDLSVLLRKNGVGDAIEIICEQCVCVCTRVKFVKQSINQINNFKRFWNKTKQDN